MSKQKHVVRMRGRPPGEFANEGEVKDETPGDFEAEVHAHEGGARPRSEVTGGPQGGTPDETEDGLDEVAEALRRAAEAPSGRREKL